CGSARTRRAELRRRGRQIETLTAKIVALEARARELAADLDDREALTTRLARDLEQVPRALRARDERIAELDAGISDALEELLREKTARRGSRVQVPRLESVEPRAIAAREPDRRLERVRGARVQLAARSLDPPAMHGPTVVLLSHVGTWRPKAGNEYRVARMLRWYRRSGYRIVPVVAPLPGEELPREGVEAIAEEFGNAVQCHRDGRVEYILRNAPPALASLDGSCTRSIGDLLWEERAPADARQRRLRQMERPFCHDLAASTVLPLGRALGPHILQVEYIWMTRVLPLVRGSVMKVVDTIDVFSSIQEKVSAFGLDDVVIEPDEEAERLRRADLI